MHTCVISSHLVFCRSQRGRWPQDSQRTEEKVEAHFNPLGSVPTSKIKASNVMLFLLRLV